MSTQAGEPRWCTLCSTETSFPVRADWKIAYASGETALVSCTGHLSDSVITAVGEQAGCLVLVCGLTQDVT